QLPGAAGQFLGAVGEGNRAFGGFPELVAHGVETDVDVVQVGGGQLLAEQVGRRGGHHPADRLVGEAAALAGLHVDGGPLRLGRVTGEGGGRGGEVLRDRHHRRVGAVLQALLGGFRGGE